MSKKFDRKQEKRKVSAISKAFKKNQEKGRKRKKITLRQRSLVWLDERFGEQDWRGLFTALGFTALIVAMVFDRQDVGLVADFLMLMLSFWFKR